MGSAGRLQEHGKTILNMAKRELYGKTKALEFKIEPICVYSYIRLPSRTLCQNIAWFSRRLFDHIVTGGKEHGQIAFSSGENLRKKSIIGCRGMKREAFLLKMKTIFAVTILSMQLVSESKLYRPFALPAKLLPRPADLRKLSVHSRHFHHRHV